MAHRLVVIGAALPFISGCAAGANLPDVKPEQRCVGGKATPLGPADVVAAFREQGFAVRSTTTGGLCGNWSRYGLRLRDLPAHDIVPADVGDGSTPHIQCRLTKGAVYPKLEIDLHAKPNSPIFSGRKAEYHLANLNCTIYPGDGDAESQIERATAAIKWLARLAQKRLR